MKKLLLVAFLTSSLSIFAQTEEGTWMIQGDTNLSLKGVASEFEYDGESTGVETSVGTFEFNPAVSYFVADNLAIGLGLGLSSTATELEIDGFKFEETSATFAVMPQVTYFFGSSRTRPYLGVGLGLMSTVTDDGDNEATYSGFGFGLNGGAAIFLSDNVSLNLGLEFAGASLTEKDDDDLKMNLGGFGITVGFGIFL
jgi:outer membrane protein